MKQISSIEQREARIHHIHDNQSPYGAVINEEVASSPEAHFHIGKSQNNPVNIPLYLQMHLGDPATKVSAIDSLNATQC